MRQITVSGHLGADAVVKTSKAGLAYMTYRIASNLRSRRQNNGQGENPNEDTIWFGVLDFDSDRIKRIAPTLKKGSHVLITGEFRQTWYINKMNQRDVSNDIFVEHFEYNGSGSLENRQQGVPQFQQPQMNGGYGQMQQPGQYQQQQMQPTGQAAPFQQPSMQGMYQQNAGMQMPPQQQPSNMGMPVQAASPASPQPQGFQQPAPNPQPVPPASPAPQQQQYPAQQVNIDGAAVNIVPTQPLSDLAVEEDLPF